MWTSLDASEGTDRSTTSGTWCPLFGELRAWCIKNYTCEGEKSIEKGGESPYGIQNSYVLDRVLSGMMPVFLEARL